jgi:hypothetical protein
MMGHGEAALALVGALVVFTGVPRSATISGAQQSVAREMLEALDIILAVVALLVAVPIVVLGVLWEFSIDVWLFWVCGIGAAWGAVEVLRKRANGYLFLVACFLLTPLVWWRLEGSGESVVGAMLACYFAFRFWQTRDELGLWPRRSLGDELEVRGPPVQKPPHVSVQKESFCEESERAEGGRELERVLHARAGRYVFEEVLVPDALERPADHLVHKAARSVVLRHHDSELEPEAKVPALEDERVVQLH